MSINYHARSLGSAHSEIFCLNSSKWRHPSERVFRWFLSVLTGKTSFSAHLTSFIGSGSLFRIFHVTRQMEREHTIQHSSVTKNCELLWCDPHVEWGNEDLFSCPWDFFSHFLPKLCFSFSSTLTKVIRASRFGQNYCCALDHSTGRLIVKMINFLNFITRNIFLTYTEPSFKLPYVVALAKLITISYKNI